MFKISIIVPVYNAEKNLRRCIDSILLQTYKNFELLLVDDGSTDVSGEICDRYIKEDCRVRVIHKSNGGVSSARNIGLDNVRGEWITFIDSDDWVSDSYLCNLLLHADNVDLVISYATFVYSNGKLIKESYDEKNVTNDYDTLFLENDLNWHTSPWAKLFRREHCDKLRFVEGMHIGEDLVFLYSYMLRCNKIYVSRETDYFYCVENEGSLTKRVNKLDDELLAYKQVKDIICDFVKIKGISNDLVLSKLNWIIAYYVRRVLNAIYYDGECRTFYCRIGYIRDLDIDAYINYTINLSYKERMFIFLLKYRFIIIYDLIRVFVAWMKK